jgi:hypothetical protein
MVGKYKVITLCGSTRFKDAFIEAQKRLTLEGNIVISVGLFGHSGDMEVWENMDEGTLTKTKEMLDDMHKRKIDMADEIYVINVGGYIGDSTRSEIEYARKTGKKVRYLEQPEGIIEEEIDCFLPSIDLDKSFAKLHAQKNYLVRYTDIMKGIDAIGDPIYQKKYSGYYRVRRGADWKREYFRLMIDYRARKDITFGEILLRLYQATGQIEASFASKMLATLDANMPIWDSNVLKALQLRLKGKNTEIRLSNAVVLYDRICSWYLAFLHTDQAKEMIERFNQEFPDYENLSETKKIDFILWASQ